MFLRKENVWVGMPHCTERMDQFAALFMKQIKANDKAAAMQVLDVAETFSKTGSDDTSPKQAKVYVDLMKKILDKGEDWYRSEAYRISQVLSKEKEKEKKSIPQEKLANLNARLNALWSFAVPLPTEILDSQIKDEL